MHESPRERQTDGSGSVPMDGAARVRSRDGEGGRSRDEDQPPAAQHQPPSGTDGNVGPVRAPELN